MKKNSELTYKEVYQQAKSFEAINNTLSDITDTLDKVFAEDWDELIFTGCGTSLYLAQTAAAAYSECCHKPAKGVPCSELLFYPESYAGNGKKVLVLPITRKSYTTEVRMAIDKIHTMKGVKTLAITCDKDSSIYNDYMILSPDTAEDSVIMTRSFTSMVYLSVIIAMYASGKKEELSHMTKGYPEMADKLLKLTDETSALIMKENPELNLFISLGQGVNYGIANECMNKMKEMGLANSEAYYSLEYRHGPMSLVDDKTLIILLANDMTTETDAKLMTQMQSYGAVTLAVGKDAENRFPGCSYYIDLEEDRSTLEYASVIGFIGQYIGYQIAEKKGLDADNPRHLTQAIVLEK